MNKEDSSLLADHEWLDICVYICEKLGYMLVDNHGWPCNSGKPFTVVADDCCTPIYFSMPFLTSFSTQEEYDLYRTSMITCRLEANDPKWLAVQLCAAKEFWKSSEKHKKRMVNPFAGKWKRLEKVSCVEEAMIVLDL